MPLVLKFIHPLYRILSVQLLQVMITQVNSFQVKEERVFRTIEPVEGCGEGCAMPE